jgi:hypothetical protein
LQVFSPNFVTIIQVINSGEFWDLSDIFSTPLLALECNRIIELAYRQKSSISLWSAQLTTSQERIQNDGETNGRGFREGTMSQFLSSLQLDLIRVRVVIVDCFFFPHKKQNGPHHALFSDEWFRRLLSVFDIELIYTNI